MKKFISKIRQIQKNYDCKDFDGYNIFRILKLTKNEVKTQSNLISDLLNPKSIYHSQSNEFFKEFVQIVFDDGFTLDSYKVKVEAKIDTKKYNEEIESGRIDIILEQEKPSKKAILIENKVYAKNQEKQLERYYEYCLKEYVSPENFRIIYLTQFGDEYITKNLHLKENVYEISYKKEIVMWLKMCYNICADINQKLILNQWINAIIYLTTNEERNVRNRLIQFEIFKNKELFEKHSNIKEIEELKKFLNTGISKHKKLYDSYEKDLKELLKNSSYEIPLAELTEDKLYEILKIRKKLKFSDIMKAPK